MTVYVMTADPFEFGDKIIAKYESYHIDPKTKSIVFSDSLDFDGASPYPNTSKTGLTSHSE